MKKKIKRKFNLGEFMLTAIPVLIMLFWILSAVGGIYLIFHPELIGEYIGKIINSFK